MKRMAAILIVAALGCSRTNRDDTIRLSGPDKLQAIDVQVGEGRGAKAGDVVVVHYTGRLANGIKFDSSVDRDEPFDFVLGKGEVIKGWDQGVAGMKPGGKRKLIIPPHLGYGDRPAGKIPPNSELHFEVELLAIK